MPAGMGGRVDGVGPHQRLFLDQAFGRISGRLTFLSLRSFRSLRIKMGSARSAQAGAGGIGANVYFRSA